MENLNNLSAEKKIETVDEWISTFSERGELGQIDIMLLKGVLESFSANFENLDEEGRGSLSKYSNKGKHLGIGQVWGARRAEFKTWTEEWVKDYEQGTGRELPKIVFTDEETGEKRPSKTEGMRQFLGEVTAYAAGCMDFPSLAMRLGARHYNFGKPKDKLEEEGGRLKITIPGYNLSEETGKEIPFAPASFPPEFPKAAWERIKSWK